MDKVSYIAVGQNYWEKRESADEALKALKKRCQGGMTPKVWKAAVYRADPETVIDGMGRFCYPRKAGKPELIRAVQITKSNGRITDLDLAEFR